MKDDMDKLIVERPRIGHDNPNLHVERERIFLSNHRKDVEALEDMPTKDSMKRFSWSQGLEKSSNENLNPLRRFLKSRVGELWDNVYSELREHINPASTIQNHIMKHLWDYVERNAIVDEKGQPYILSSWNADGYTPMYKSRYGNSFYIHPVSGELLEPPPAPKKPPRKPWGYDPDKIILTETTFLHRIKNIWYFVEKTETEFLDFYGRLLKKESLDKHQLNKKELKKYGISNG